MRASRKVKSEKLKVKSHKNSSPLTPHSSLTNEHISGAEGIYEEPEISKILREYTERALNHPRGKPDEIIITVEKIKQEPEKIPSLPVTTLKCSSPFEAKKIIKNILGNISISEAAIETAFNVLYGKQTMRGAALVLAGSGKRAEPDKARGIRVSRLGITKNAQKSLSLKLSKYDINNSTVREAIILASKVASCSNVLAELCISDDPDYTTGYIAARQFGYVRIPNIKRKDSRQGGRIFFIKGRSSISAIVDYLEKKPVLINEVSEGRGILTTDEILNSNNR